MHARHPFSLASRTLGAGSALVLALVSIAPVQAAGVSTTAPTIHAEVGGHAIALADVSRYHCHDLASPLIRCFATAAARDADEAAMVGVAGPGQVAPGVTTSTATFYVRWYLDANYGGASFDASVAYRDLGAIGWNDKISSFMTYAGGHPRWWKDVGFAGVGWDWGTGVSVPNVGTAANDQFSSVERL